MKCPHCKGLKLIRIPVEPGTRGYDIICPVCEGEGDIPDPKEFPNNCLACGEPIELGQKYCRFHKEAEKYE
ncbi:MAG: hypothetical protein U7123_07260 [Potamolinea sp.]